MSEIRLVPAPLNIDFELDELGDEKFMREYNSILPDDEDPLGAWLKRAKARGETKESDQVLLTLLVELHRKIDELSNVVTGDQKSYIALAQSAQIESIGFEHVRLSEPKFEVGRTYYARILMPIFPKRYVATYLTAIDARTGKIKDMHEEDASDWASYVTARERVMIRRMRSNS